MSANVLRGYRCISLGAIVTVFAGMIGVTLFGLFLTPVFYVALRKFVTRRGRAAEAKGDLKAETTHA